MLPMMYMPDLLKATTELMMADESKLTQRTYNIGSLSFTPAQLAESIAKFVPGFEIDYAPDFRQVSPPRLRALTHTHPASNAARPSNAGQLACVGCMLTLDRCLDIAGDRGDMAAAPR